MLVRLDKVLSALPLDGFKTAVGWLLTTGADFIPDPKVQMVVKAVGQFLVAVGLIHKGVKENVPE